MKKKSISIILCILTLTQIFVVTAAAKGPDSFQKTLVYDDTVFEDIAGRWFENDVKAAYEYGMAEGVGDKKFAPDECISVAEVIVMAARINSVYYDKKIYSEPGAWYTKYITYALSAGIIRGNQFVKYNREATRQEMAALFYKTLPMSEYPAINTVESIPDFDKDAVDSEAVYALYRAGVLTGDEDGFFRPKDTVTRAEAAAILIRTIVPERRVIFAPIVEGDRDNLAYFIKADNVGMIVASILLNASAHTFIFETYDGTWMGAAVGNYEANGSYVLCAIFENRMERLPGADIAFMYFMITETGLVLTNLFTKDGDPVNMIGVLEVGEGMRAAR